MDGEEDLQLSLSLQTAEIDRHISSQLASSDTIEMSSNLRGIDVNRIPVTSRMDAKDVPSPPPKSGGGSWISVFERKRRSAERDENECGICRAAVSEEEEGETARKKLRLSKKQSAVLEESFKENNTLNPKQKVALAKELNLRPRQVEVWFQNRRARTKLKQTEVDYEFLKRCCDKLTEENRRLRQELLELQALNRSRHFKMPVPATTALTMCPTCERVEPSENQTALHSRHQIRL